MPKKTHSVVTIKKRVVPRSPESAPIPYGTRYIKGRSGIKLLTIGTLLIWLFDIATKILAQNTLAEPLKITSFLKLELIHNANIAFGIPFPLLITILLSIVAIVLFIYVFIKETPKKSKIALVTFSLLLGGAFGNLSERVFFGSVTDFITLGPIPNFNLADTALTFGMIILILRYKQIFNHGT